MTLRSTLAALALSVAIVGGSAAAAFASPLHHHHHGPGIWHGPVYIDYYDYGYHDRAYYAWWWWHFRHTHHWHPYIPH
jgi:hypothetical protein